MIIINLVLVGSIYVYTIHVYVHMSVCTLCVDSTIIVVHSYSSVVASDSSE